MFNYFYNLESEKFSFFRIPKLLITDPVFKTLTTDAKFLYGLFLDRMSLSEKNNWRDEDGKVFIYYTIETVMEHLHCGNKKAGRLINDLVSIGLIEKKPQGLNKPNKIYVKNFVKNENRPNISNSHLMGTTHSQLQSTVDTNPETIIKLDDSFQQTEKYIKDNISYEDLLYSGIDKDTLDEILLVMIDVFMTENKSIFIDGEKKSLALVRSVYMKVKYNHIELICDNFELQYDKITNKKNYLRTMLYNTPMELKHYYSNLVKSDTMKRLSQISEE